jgi:hypothetical protein
MICVSSFIACCLMFPRSLINIEHIIKKQHSLDGKSYGINKTKSQENVCSELLEKTAGTLKDDAIVKKTYLINFE